MKTIKDFLCETFKNDDEFTLKDAYAKSDYPKHSIRARIYENIGVNFERLGKGIYKVINDSCIVIEGNGRDLSMIEDESIDIEITDHPWLDTLSNTGGDRKFANTYDCFNYSLEDFKEKARVLKQGSFLIEILPFENENNYEYLFSIKQMAKEAGFRFFTKTLWKKGGKPYNTGRNQSNLMEIVIFSKGKARALRPNKKKMKALGGVHYMSGAACIVPSILDIEPVSKQSTLHQAEKPSELIEKLLEMFSLENEICLDQFAGSGSTGEACIKTNRKCILIEILHENIEKIIDRLNLVSEQFIGA